MQIESDVVAMAHSKTALKRVACVWAFGAAAALAGCSNAPLPSLTTGSLFGSKPDAAAPVVKNDPMTRTLQVSRVAAKAQRCGYNLDTAKLKGNFLAGEGTQAGADVAELAKLDKVYTSSFNGTMKAASADEAYCSQARTAHVKADLTRHLAGDYAPGSPFKDPNAEEDGGLFSGSGGIFDGSASATPYKSPSLPTDNR